MDKAEQQTATQNKAIWVALSATRVQTVHTDTQYTTHTT